MDELGSKLKNFFSGIGKDKGGDGGGESGGTFKGKGHRLGTSEVRGLSARGTAARRHRELVRVLVGGRAARRTALVKCVSLLDWTRAVCI